MTTDNELPTRCTFIHIGVHTRLCDHDKYTFFLSSPHLHEVRERMRINGEPISKELFTQYFWECWNTFEVGVESHRIRDRGSR